MEQVVVAKDDDERVGAEVVYRDEECQKRSQELLEEMGFPKGVLLLKDLVECGGVRDTGFVWMKQKAPSQHYFEEAKTSASYATEVTCYVEKGKVKKISGVKSKQLLMWITVTDMYVDNNPCSGKVHFKTAVGIRKSFPITVFMTPHEKLLYNKTKTITSNTTKPETEAEAAAAAAAIKQS